MEIKFILTIIIGALTQIGSVPIFDDSGCTYTGANVNNQLRVIIINKKLLID